MHPYSSQVLPAEPVSPGPAVHEAFSDASALIDATMQPPIDEAQAAPSFDEVAAEARQEFEALVDEIEAELAAHWDEEEGIGDDAGEASGQASETGGRPAESRLRQYARELVAAAYINRDNSAWDPAEANSYRTEEPPDALLATLLELSDAMGDDDAQPASGAEQQSPAGALASASTVLSPLSAPCDASDVPDGAPGTLACGQTDAASDEHERTAFGETAPLRLMHC